MHRMTPYQLAVGNLPANFTEADVVDLFEPFGDVLEVDIMNNLKGK